MVISYKLESNTTKAGPVQPRSNLPQTPPPKVGPTRTLKSGLGRKFHIPDWGGQPQTKQDPAQPVYHTRCDPLACYRWPLRSHNIHVGQLSVWIHQRLDSPLFFYALNYASKMFPINAPYSGKLSREKTFTNFEVLCYFEVLLLFVKTFSTKLGGRGIFRFAKIMWVPVQVTWDSVLGTALNQIISCYPYKHLLSLIPRLRYSTHNHRGRVRWSGNKTNSCL